MESPGHVIKGRMLAAANKLMYLATITLLIPPRERCFYVDMPVRESFVPHCYTENSAVSLLAR